LAKALHIYFLLVLILHINILKLKVCSSESNVLHWNIVRLTPSPSDDLKKQQQHRPHEKIIKQKH